MPREALRFQTNVPETIALAFDEGKPVQGRFGDQIFYTLVDDRVAYVPLIVDAKRRELGIRRNEEFTVCKREVAEGTRRGVRWEVERLQTDEPEAATSSPEPAASAHQSSCEPPQRTTPPAALAPLLPDRPRTKLEEALRTVVHAIHFSRQYAKEIGFEMPVFTAEDIRTMANTLMIQNGGGR